MGLYFEIPVYVKELQRRKTQIIDIARHSVTMAGQNMWANAYNNAPEKTGELKSGINVKQVNPNKVIVTSKVRKSFPYNLFVNRTEPYRTLDYRKYNHYFKVPQKVTYGKHAVSPSGKDIVWTANATPFWDVAYDSTRDFLFNNAVRSIISAFEGKAPGYVDLFNRSGSKLMV